MNLKQACVEDLLHPHLVGALLMRAADEVADVLAVAPPTCPLHVACQRLQSARHGVKETTMFNMCNGSLPVLEADQLHPGLILLVADAHQCRHRCAQQVCPVLIISFHPGFKQVLESSSRSCARCFGDHVLVEFHKRNCRGLPWLKTGFGSIRF